MTDPRRTTYTVQVHKANIPLQGAESLDDFIMEVSKAARPFLIDHFGGTEESGGAWAMEVYATKAIFHVYPDWDDSSKDVLAQVEFTRDGLGEFAFSDVTKVKRVTTYEVTKSAEPVEVKKSLFAGVV